MKPITIIGGGLAGLSLGIGLRRKSVPVTIIEAGRYPRHKVCGEFISGRGQETLHRLGLYEALNDAGALEARSASFVVSDTATNPVRRLPDAALCVSRFELDTILSELFAAAGGELRQETRWRNEALAEGQVRANGRRAQAQDDGWRWYGLKVHARNVPLRADLEMHLVPNGYIGLCRLPRGEVNICGLFRSSGTRDAVGAPTFQSPAISAGSAAPAQSKTTDGSESLRTGKSALRPLLGSPGGTLHQRLATAELAEGTFCSVAGLSLRPRRAAEFRQCAIGDALTMTPPVTGNGMSMAFESAEVAVEPLTAYSRGELSWEAARRRVAGTCDARFQTRLAWAGRLQSMMFCHSLQKLLGPLLVRSGFFWHIMFRKTR
jgi:2-polyprenyl-6-methoxyphenol hydroxylase-like FAD-dependent oxidoreductase